MQSLYSSRARRFNLVPVDADAYAGETRDHTCQRITSGSFRVGNELIRFRTVLHCPIPPDAIVKKVMWLEDRYPTRGWQRSIAITIEQQPPALPAHAGV
jgi:hypothetical protein